MHHLSSIAFGLAVVLVATAGLAAIFGAERIRDTLLRLASGAVVLALAPPILSTLVAQASHDAPRFGGGSLDMSPLLPVAFVVGHVSLGVFLLRRRAGAERAGFATDIEAARGRERVRLTPPIAREDVR
ncbi:MAG: hypothetical protein WCK01_00415 [Candidatus Uhrbacteria bacterium]